LAVRSARSEWPTPKASQGYAYRPDGTPYPNRDPGIQLEDRDLRGMTQRRYAYDIALPKYLAKIEKALSQPKQRTLMDALL